jgi:hypothetical protein
MKYLIAAAILATLAQQSAQASGGSASVNASSSIVQHVQSQSHSANTPLLSAALTEPVAINRVSAVLALDQATIFIDPVGPQDQYRRFGRPDIVVLTRAHPSHLSIDTMIGLLRRDTVVLAPQAVIDQLPLMISNNVIAPFEAGMKQEVGSIMFRALSSSAPIPFGATAFQRERGDIGVLMEVDGALVYF